MAKRVKDQAAGPESNGPTYDVFLAHSREVQVALSRKAEADSVLQHAYKRAKAAGLDLAPFKAAHKAKKRTVEEVQWEARNFAQYMTWLGMPLGSQASMFDVQPATEKGLAEVRERDAEQAGYTAGTHGSTIADCPYKPGEALHAAWVRGLHGGVAFMEQKTSTGAAEPVAARSRGSRRSTTPAAATPTPSADNVHRLDTRKTKTGGRGTTRKAGTRNLPPDVPTVLPDEEPGEARDLTQSPGTDWPDGDDWDHPQAMN